MTEESAPDPLAAVLASIAARARHTNLTRVEEIGTALDLAASGSLDQPGRAAAEQTAHQLAGSAGTFGFAEVSEHARALERFLAETAGPGVPDPEPLAAARSVLAAAEAALAEEPGPGSAAPDQGR